MNPPAEARPKVNWARGLFRLWVMLTVLWMLAVAAFSWSSVTEPYIFLGPQTFTVGAGDTMARVAQAEALGTAEAARLRPDLREVKVDRPPNDLSFPLTYSVFVPVGWSEAQAEAAVAEATATLRAIVLGEQEARRPGILFGIGVIMLAPPLVLLLFGTLVGWVLIGFRDRADQKAAPPGDS